MGNLKPTTICGDACPLSCVSAEACLTGWPNARKLKTYQATNKMPKIAFCLLLFLICTRSLHKPLRILSQSSLKSDTIKEQSGHLNGYK